MKVTRAMVAESFGEEKKGCLSQLRCTGMDLELRSNKGLLRTRSEWNKWEGRARVAISEAAAEVG